MHQARSGTGGIAENETDTVSVFWELPDSGGWVGRQIISQETKSIINCDKCCLRESNWDPLQSLS